jgi:hypothetical protein
MEALISSTIPNFVNGVSQQPYTLRLNSQGDLQENGLSTVAQGLKKRPPTKHIKKIINTAISNAFLHTINRDTTEQYVVVVTNGDLKVFDKNGVEKTVSFPDGKSYLTSTKPSEEFAAVTVADYTFIVNKSIAVEQSTLYTPERPYEALVNVKSGNYGKTYEVILNGSVVASYTTPDGGSPSHSTAISTDNIASQLATSYANTTTSQTITNRVNKTTTQQTYGVAPVTEGEVGGSIGTAVVSAKIYYYAIEFDLPAGCTATNTIATVNGKNMSIKLLPSGKFRVDVPTVKKDKKWVFPQTVPTLTVGKFTNGIYLARYGSTLHFSSNTTDFTIDVRDGFNGNAMVAIKNETTYFNDLPTNAGINGIKVQVVGTADERRDNYWTEYDTSESTGVWKESVAPNIPNGFYYKSMPHVLVRNSDGTFTFFAHQWDTRNVGDLESAKDPSFVGKKISDVFFYRNRLGFLCDESISFSEDGEYFNFYPTTVTALLDSDRIDVTTAHTKVANLKHAVGFNKQLVLFSEQTQFVVEDNDTLTPKNISVKVTSEFPCNVIAKPIGIGKNIYFVADKDEFSQFREYFPDANNFNYDSLDITGHLPKYIPSGVFKMTAAPNEDTLIALSNKDPNVLYVYKFFWSNSEKLQSSWSKFTLGSEATILNADFIQSELLLVVKRADGVYLESMNFALGAIDGDEPFYVHLDRKVELGTAALTHVSGYTYVNQTTLGYVPQYGSHKAVIRSGTGFKPGIILDVIWDGTNAKIKGNYVGAQITVGQSYTFKYRLSPITLRQASATGGQKSDTEGRLQIRKVAFNYADSGFFEVKVTPEGRDTNTYIFSGKKLGQESGVIGTYNVSTGQFLVPVVTRNTTVDISLENSSPLPSSFLSADWEGMYVKRSRGV